VEKSPRPQAFIAQGARQVGKTYALRAFGRAEFENTLYLNFENTPSLARLFADSLKPEVILQALALEMDMDIIPGKTLIIFDEVQEWPEALNSLKYFNELALDYHICAAGSLLGVKLAHIKGFPVGQVEFAHLYPLSFPEFLHAIGQEKLKGYMEEISVIAPLPSNLHEKLLHYFKHYLFIGGMPQVIAKYVETEDLRQIREMQNAILQAYQLDFAKHAPAHQIMKINQIWQSLPSQLAREKKKFKYSAVQKGGRAKEFEIALQWLTEAGLIYKTSNITAPKLPLKAYAESDFFKLYMVDVGLLGVTANLPAKAVLYGNELFQEFHGALTENYVAQELARNQYDLYYWTSKNTAELDFVLQNEDQIYPLEIKSGYSSRKKSLGVYDEKYHPPLLVRSSPMNLKQDALILQGNLTINNNY
jgi:uncharacterized protein